MLQKFAVVALLAAVAAFAPADAGTEPAAPAPMVAETDPVMVGGPPFRRLFLDPMVMEESGGLERVFHAAKKCEVNPILVEEKPWEEEGPRLGGTVIREGGKLRMYYYTHPQNKPAWTCVAESNDGIHWTKPIVGDVEYKGSTENNIVRCVTQVFKLNNPPSPDHKWVTYGLHGSGAKMGYSPDGLRWTWDPSARGLFSSGDVINWFYDPYGHRMCATWKCSSRRHRSVGVVFSKDGLKWDKPINGPVFAPDGLDPDATQIYGMPVFAYQGMYIGLPWIYHARWIKYGKYASAQVMYEAQEGSPRTIDVQIAWSWDLIAWTRTPKREPFIANGPPGAFDYGVIITAHEPITMGDELWFYYCGCNKIHDDLVGPKTAIGVAKLRLDGFCSMHAGKKEGWLISRREVFNTPKVTINARCAPGGYVSAELVDRNNNVIPGFARDNCVPFTGDSVRGELTWKTKQFHASYIDKDKKVRFCIKNADLYSYLPVDINQQIDDGWPDK